MEIFSTLFRPLGLASTKEKKVKKKKIEVTIDELFNRSSLDKNYDQEDDGFGGPIHNYTLIDFVAIPPTFKIETFFGMREHAGIVEHSSVDIDQVKKIAFAVACSPVFASMNNHRISVSSCLYFLSLLDELNLIVKTIPNPLRMRGDTYKRYINDENQNEVYIARQRTERLNFIIINVCQLLTQDIIDDAVDTANKAEETQLELDTMLSKLEKID